MKLDHPIFTRWPAQYPDCLVHDTAATNTNARRFYKREELVDAVIGFVKPLGSFA